MPNSKEAHAEWPELLAFPTFSAAWYARYRDLHLAKYPDVDQRTRHNLNMFVEQATFRERPEIREALDGALNAEPEELVSRGSFVEYAEEVDT